MIRLTEMYTFELGRIPNDYPCPLVFDLLSLLWPRLVNWAYTDMHVLGFRHAECRAEVV